MTDLYLVRCTIAVARRLACKFSGTTWEISHV